MSDMSLNRCVKTMELPGLSSPEGSFLWCSKQAFVDGAIAMQEEVCKWLRANLPAQEADKSCLAIRDFDCPPRASKAFEDAAKADRMAKAEALLMAWEAGASLSLPDAALTS
jgi:hypothetical protein